MPGELADIFGQPAFNMVSLTQSLNTLPLVPGRLGAIGLFPVRGITTREAVIEERHGVLHLIESKPFGSPSSVPTPETKKVRSIPVPHFPLDDAVMASDVIGKRAFGSTNQLETVVQKVADKLTALKRNHDVTHEYLRAGAIQGKVYDADGTTLLADLFTIFNIAEQSFNFELGTTTKKIRTVVLRMKKAMEEALGLAVYDHIHAFCGYEFFERFVDHDDVRKAYERFQDGEMLRNDPRAGFPFAGVIWEQYVGKVGNREFIDPKTARFVPIGAPGFAETAAAPADMMSAVGTVGLPYYASQALMDHDKGVNLHTQSNVIPYVTRPGALMKGTSSN